MDIDLKIGVFLVGSEVIRRLEANKKRVIDEDGGYRPYYDKIAQIKCYKDFDTEFLYIEDWEDEAKDYVYITKK